MKHRNVGIVVDVINDRHSLRVPERRLGSAAHRLDQPGLVLGHDPQRRRPRAQRQAVGVLADPQPALHQRLPEPGVCQRGLAVGRTDLEDPVHEPQLEGSSVPHPAHAAVGQRIDRDHRRQMGRVRLGERVLGTSRVAGAERADLAVGPPLRGDPLDDVMTVLGIIGQPMPGSCAGEAPARVVGDDHVASLRIVLALAGRAALVVGRAGQERGEAPGAGLPSRAGR